MDSNIVLVYGLLLAMLAGGQASPQDVNISGRRGQGAVTAPAAVPQAPNVSASLCVKVGDGYEKRQLDLLSENLKKRSDVSDSGELIHPEMYLESDDHGRIGGQTIIYYYGVITIFVPSPPPPHNKVIHASVNEGKKTVSEVMKGSSDADQTVNVPNYVKRLNTNFRLVAVPRITVATITKDHVQEQYYIVTPRTLVPTRVFDDSLDQSSVVRKTQLQRYEEALMKEKANIDWEGSYLAPAEDVKEWLEVPVHTYGCLPSAILANENVIELGAEQLQKIAYPKLKVEVTPEATRFVQCCLEFWRIVDAAIDNNGTANQQTPLACPLFK